MAEKWCDHEAYGVYAAVPTWGEAQDGDGTAKTVGTPSTAEVVFTGIASTGVIAVLGQTITFTRVTDANTCANNLATAINASTAVATGPASFTTLSQVRNHLYARGPANGAPAGTCQIMTRQASAAHAGQIAMTHTLNNVSSPATINFVGGTGGCWGWLFNNLVSIWPSAAAQGTYGLWAAGPNFTGSQDPGDEIHIRCRSITRPNNTTLSLSPPARGSRSFPVIYRVDTAVQWPEDAPNPVLRITSNFTSNNGLTLGINIQSFCAFLGSQYADGTKNFEIVSTGDGQTLPTARLGMDGGVKYRDIELRAETTSTGGVQVVSTTGSASGGEVWSVFERVRMKHLGATGTSSHFLRQTLNVTRFIHFIECEFSAPNGLSPWDFGIFDYMGAGGQNRLVMDGCKFSGFLQGSRLLAERSTFGGQYRYLVARDCDWGGVSNRGPNLLQSADRDSQYDRFISIGSAYGAQEFSVERARVGFIEWNASGGFPTLNARLKDGLTPWSIFAITAPYDDFSLTGGMELPALHKEVPPSTELTEGVRTLTLNLLLESTLTWGSGQVAALLTYEQPDGAVRVVDSQDELNLPLQDAPGALWSSLTYNAQTWLPKRVTFVTPTAVKAGSVVRAIVRICAPSTNVTTGAFLDPEIVVS